MTDLAINKLFHRATFLLSTAESSQWPEGDVAEIAFVGGSNVGKSTTINALTNQRKLAKTSKTPGRTQLINFFTLDEHRRIVDLPGYGYAKVPSKVKKEWGKHIESYLVEREGLRGLVLLIDSRHPLKITDKQMIEFCHASEIPVLVVLTKCDKISKNQGMKNKFVIQDILTKEFPGLLLKDIVLFSATNKTNIDKLYANVEQWLSPING